MNVTLLLVYMTYAQDAGNNHFRIFMHKAIASTMLMGNSRCSETELLCYRDVLYEKSKITTSLPQYTLRIM